MTANMVSHTNMSLRSATRSAYHILQENLHYHVREHDRHNEMRQKNGSRVESFFSTNNVKDRPNSVYTEFMESDWEMEEDDIYSDMEDLAQDDEVSPRNSIGSVRHSHLLFPSPQYRLLTKTKVNVRGSAKLHNNVFL